MNSEKSVNVYLSTPEDRKRVYGDDKPDPHKHFIIVQNEILTSKSDRLTDENSKLLKEIEEKDNEVDKMEVQLRYIRGELKNFVELRKMADAITTHVENIETKTKDQLDKWVKFIPRFLTQFVLNKTLSVINCILLWYFNKLTIPFIITTELVTTITTVIVTGISPIDIKDYKKGFLQYTETHSVATEEVKKIKDEMKRTDDGNDFISKYIDCM